MNSELMDWIAASLAFIAAGALFSFHVITSPSRRNWFTLPEYIRKGICIAGAMLLWRSVNFTVIDAEDPGHANPEALMALATTTYLFCAGVFYAVSKTYPARVWDRLNYITHLASCGGQSKKAEQGAVLTDLAMSGMKVIPPGAGPESVTAAIDRHMPHSVPEDAVR